MPNRTKEVKEEILSLYNSGFKVCTKCLETLPLADFYPVRTIGSLIPYTRVCKQCSSATMKVWYQKVKEVARIRKERRNRAK